eukprot:TRINITY_DN13703_c2_g1_i1.p1 TRINITY_DN13703_c2_g1~~TRINITY_DN13703_c2_g1_i1.p1  ORF type:complete len:357 (+),score=85.88 TRINITY_DN13703_c2_g1_i1:170-1240(+)
MEALNKINIQKPPLHLSHPCHFFTKPLLPSSPFPKTLSSNPKTSLTASFHPHFPPKPLPSLQNSPQNLFHSQKTPLQNPSHSLKPLSSLLKSISLSIATIALLLSRFPTKPTFAAAAPPTTAESTPVAADAVQEEEEEKEKEKERTFLEYLDSHPDNEDALKALMATQIKLGKLIEAIDSVDRLILLQPTKKEWLLLRSHLHLHVRDVETAKSAFEDIIAADPFDIEAYHGLTMAVAQSGPGELDALIGRIEDVMESCKKAKMKENLRDFKLLVAQIKVVEEKFEDALKLYQELVKEEPRDFRPYLCQGILYTLMGKKEDAEQQFGKYRRLVPRGQPYSRYFDEKELMKKGFSFKR